MRKIRTAGFNLVEIILAMGVIAIGMSAVMALLPPALNANRNAMGDAVASEVASKMITYIDYVAKNVAMNQSDDDWKGAMETRFPKYPSTRPGLSAAGETPSGTKLPAPFDDFYETTPVNGGKFTYSQTIAGEELSAANILVWCEAIPNVLKYGSGGRERPGYRFYIKVCWPATAPVTGEGAKPRQERIFVYEFLRPVQN